MDGQNSGWRVRHLATHGTAVNAIVGTIDDGRPVAVTAGDDGALQVSGLAPGASSYVWRPDLAPMTKVQIPGEAPQPTALASSPDGSFVYSGWSDGTIRTGPVGSERMPVDRRPGPGTSVSALQVFDEPGGVEPRIVCALVDGLIVTWRPTHHLSDPDAGLSSLRDGGMPAWRLAVGDQPSGKVVYAGVGEGWVERWSVGADDVRRLEPWRIRSPDRSPLLVCTVATEVVATNFDHIDVWDSLHDKLIASYDVGIGEISALHPLQVEGTPMVAIGSVSGQVVLKDPLTGVHLGEPIDVGEPIADLGSVESDGRDVLLVGGRDGGVYVVEPVDSRVEDSVELQDDLPGQTREDDRLRRSPLAEALAVRLLRRHEDGREASFLVHLDGRWGSGKTTVLNLVAAELGDGWTIVRYNAWRQARVGPPWWTLLTALRTETMRRRSWLRRAALWWSEMLRQRIRQASGLPATILLLLAAAGVFLVIRPNDADAGDTLTTVQGVAAALTALATLFAGSQFVARFFSWNSPRGAKAFEDLDTNPMDRIAGHFSWLVRREGRPIAFFVDDIDRCTADHVVELLEAVQTLVRDAAENNDKALSPCFVVAGDGAWIRNAFEEHYANFAPQIGEPGRPLGYLFLAKIFQLTLPLPRIGPLRQSQFFRELLGLSDDSAPSPEDVDSARSQVEAAPNDDAQQQVLEALPQTVREMVAPAAVRRQTERAFAEATEHRLSGFAPLLPDNPRAVKRFLNAFALMRSVRTVEGQAIPTATLALWTILQTRWPLLADHLAEHPTWVARAGNDPAALPPQIPDPVRVLLDDPEVQAVLNFADGGPLTSDLIVACRGG